MAVERAANIRVGIIQKKFDPGRIRANEEKIIASIHEAQTLSTNPSQAQELLLATTELALPGYLSRDLFLQREFIKENKEALKRVAKEVVNMTAIIGFADYIEEDDVDKEKYGEDWDKMRFNSAAIIRNGEIIGVVDKTYLPNDDTFDEERYFDTPRQTGQVFDIDGRKIGVELCHDIWEDKPIDITEQLKANGAEIVVNLSASPFSVNRIDERRELLKRRSKDVTIVYANTVGGQEHLIFDGQSMVVYRGRIVRKGKAFREDLVMFNLDGQKKPAIKERDMSEEEQIYNALVLGIKDYFRQAEKKKAVIGLSGGIDSAVTAALAVKALGKNNVTGIAMPSVYSSSESIRDAEELAHTLGIKFIVSPITDAYNSEVASVRAMVGTEPKDITKQNIQARIRGQRLMSFANDKDALVMNTGNKTELALGYCTLHGDMVGAIAPLGDLNKLRVRKLAEYINQLAVRRTGKVIIPENTITRPPSAELTDNQTDEASFGVPYETLSPLADSLLEKEPDYDRLSTHYGKDLESRTWRTISMTEYKRRMSAIIPRVTQRALSLAADRRYPISHRFRFDD